MAAWKHLHLRGVLVSKSSVPSTLPGLEGPMGNDMPLPMADKRSGNIHILHERSFSSLSGLSSVFPLQSCLLTWLL